MDYPLPSTDPLGTDAELDQNGDLVSLTSGDISIVQNADNVSQSVRTNITTIPDTYLWGESVGTQLSQYVDVPITETIKTEITSIITEILQNDDRILLIQSIDIDDQSIVNGLFILIMALVDSVGVVQIPVILGGAS